MSVPGEKFEISSIKDIPQYQQLLPQKNSFACKILVREIKPLDSKQQNKRVEFTSDPK